MAKSVTKIEELPESARQRLEELSRSMTLEMLDPSTLGPNNLNPNKHPSRQRKAMSEFMDELERRRTDANPVTAFVDVLKWNRRTGRLLDGHLRQTEALERGEPVVPVLVFDVDEETENLILLYMDLIGQMAERDKSKEQELLDMIDLENETLLDLLDSDERIPDAAPEKKMTKRSEMPEGGLALPLGMKFDYIVLLYRTEVDYVAACDHFGIERQQCPFTGGVGRGRVVDGAAYLSKIRKQIHGDLDEDLLVPFGEDGELDDELDALVEDDDDGEE